MESTRREFLTDATVAGSGVLLTGSGLLGAPPSLPNGELVRTIHFRGSRRSLEKVIGKGWHGRYYQDLAKLTEKTLVTPNDRFYIRTRCSEKIGDTKNWQIALEDLDEAKGTLAAKDLAKRAKPQGVRVLECSGNTGHFGLLSAAKWSGVPILDVLDENKLDGDYVLVEGFDRYPNFPANTLQSGCSWIFTRKQLAKAGAFLATHMNGVPLPPDHGFPVRLFVPGWYGCTCVKWVQKIAIVDDMAKATNHMREYARRTHQKGSPRRAKDYRPAEMDTAAMPIRVEEWREKDATVFKIIGVVWGGDRVVSGLNLHIGDQVMKVSDFKQKTHETWSLWSHEWNPERKGRFSMWLTVPDEKVRTRRLDKRYYRRRIEI